MRAFDYGELDGMRATQDSAMMDTCILGERVELSRDVYGMPVVGWSWGDPVICGLNPVKHVEIMDGTEVVLTDAMLRLPIDTVITHVDRVQITHRYGEALIMPWVFACIGMPRRGPSGLLLNLRMITFGAGIAEPGSGSGSGYGSGEPGSGSGSGGPPPPILGIVDTYTGLDGEDALAHVPDSCPLGALYGAVGPVPACTGDIQGNQLRIMDNGDGQVRGFTIESGLADGTIIITMTGNAIGPTAPGIFFRDDGADRLLAWASWFLGTAYILDVGGGVLTSGAWVAGASDVIRITVTLLGASITALFENLTDATSVLLSTTSASNQAATRHGPAARTVTFAGVQDYFDDFSVA
jgi:hypothetical protein